MLLRDPAAFQCNLARQISSELSLFYSKWYLNFVKLIGLAGANTNVRQHFLDANKHPRALLFRYVMGEDKVLGLGSLHIISVLIVVIGNWVDPYTTAIPFHLARSKMCFDLNSWRFWASVATKGLCVAVFYLLRALITNKSLLGSSRCVEYIH